MSDQATCTIITEPLSQGEGINNDTLFRYDGNLSGENMIQEAKVNSANQTKCNSNLPLTVTARMNTEIVSDHANDQHRGLNVPMIDQSKVSDNSENKNIGSGDLTNTDTVAEDNENAYDVTDEEDIPLPFMTLFTCIGQKAKNEDKCPYQKLAKDRANEPQIDPFRQTQWKLLNMTHEYGVIPSHPYIQQLTGGGSHTPDFNWASASTLMQFGKTNSGTVNTVDRPVEVSSAREHLSSNYDVSQDTVINQDLYDFSHPHRGYAIVIVNQLFTRLLKRNGAEVDLIKTKEFLRKLGYLNKNIERYNLDKESTLAILQDAQDTDHSNMDSFALIISSHGNEMEHPRNGKKEHVIYCSDDQYIFTGDILEMFSDENCPSLKGKPKLFFIQACRGTNTDDGAQIGIHVDNRKDVQEHSIGQNHSSRSQHDGRSPNEHTLEFVMHPGSESGLRDRVQCVDDTNARSFEDISEDKPIVNCNNDYLVMYATPSGHCAWRSNDDGSWMLHYLWQEVMNYDYLKPCSFLKVLTAVNRKMADRETNVPDNLLKSGKKAIPVINHQLDKDIVFQKK
ncbi:hypothetical protein CHS0354_031363 [Potamilus streckersoni]|uniref:Uncharacterized protein n=1 Tax=Potamilus streckersoni TaxID=2493646 RepID=A0AAE0SJX1_9BIVA|nr:hypothetical protein CHS0354_031363 [Potamilus streckersoni]